MIIARNTGIKDRYGYDIYTGDIVFCEFDYFLLVCQNPEEPYNYYGSPILEFGHPCRDIPYDVNGGAKLNIIISTGKFE